MNNKSQKCKLRDVLSIFTAFHSSMSTIVSSSNTNKRMFHKKPVSNVIVLKINFLIINRFRDIWKFYFVFLLWFYCLKYVQVFIRIPVLHFFKNINWSIRFWAINECRINSLYYKNLTIAVSLIRKYINYLQKFFSLYGNYFMYSFAPTPILWNPCIFVKFQ